MSAEPQTLDGPYLDLIRTGAPSLADAYGAEYDRRVWHALNRTALAAMQHGLDFARWTYLLDESISHLGHQARRAGGRKERTTSSYRKLLIKVWENAEEYVKARPRPTAEQVAAVIAEARSIAADPYRLPNPNDRAVLTAACDLADKHGSVRPALPLPELMTRTGLTRKAVRCALARLAAAGVMTRARRGDVRKRLAALYDLLPPNPAKGTYTPEDRTTCPSRIGLCAPAAERIGLCAPEPDPTPEEGHPVPANPEPQTSDAHAVGEVNRWDDQLCADPGHYAPGALHCGDCFDCLAEREAAR
ncbi:hypothetical protein DQ238_01230 [Geodermatophilus sp. TF02-6]|uniref:hypothetical protein n=1 Tax=Geodermatophilus sp. TF02-6 TaxID=2250575 RepID=UPI000DE9D376|nr:hypothetical protein [Geodermatophilus sp. TF02-6]RBY83729.1 hypothetical protein DQ238_01230 [Geodermatophilus sp. TF02-6]